MPPFPRWPLWTVLLLSALLGLGFMRATPVGGAPDEGAHLQYVRVLATEARLPQLNITQRRNSHADPDYESHQSPAYYALSVPFFMAGKALAGEDGAAQGCRILSLLIGLLGTWLVWRIAREVAPERPYLALAAAGFAAFLPMRLAVNASVSNDAAAEASSSLALLLMLQAMRHGWDVRRAAWIGAAVTLALLCKQSAILLLPPLLLSVYLGAKQSAPLKDDMPDEKVVWSRFLTWGAVAGGVIALGAGWWFVRNHLLYGDPLGQKVFNWYFEDTTRWVQFRDEMGWSFGQYLTRLVLPTSTASFWGAFGHLSPERPELWMGVIGKGYPPPSWLYPLLNGSALLAAVGWVIALVRSARSRNAENERSSRRTQSLEPATKGARGEEAVAAPFGAGILTVHANFVVAAFLNFNSTYFQAQGRYLFPAIAAISLSLCGGWLVPARRRESVVAWVIVLTMMVLALYALFGVVFPGFQGA